MGRLQLLLLGLVFLAACNSDVEGGGNSGSGGSAGASTSSSSSGGASVQCSDGAPSVFPLFDKSCTMAADCVIAMHQVSCCGTLTAIGINVAQSSAFDAAEATCEMQYPGCGCPQSPTTTEDGKTSMDDTLIQAGCTNGKCMTFLP